MVSAVVRKFGGLNPTVGKNLSFCNSYLLFVSHSSSDPMEMNQP